MCAKKTKSTTHAKRHAGRTLSSAEKKKITHSKIATKNASNPFDSFTVKRHMNVKGQRSQTVKLSQAHSRDLQTRRDTLLVELRNKDRSSNFSSVGNGDDVSSSVKSYYNSSRSGGGGDDEDRTFFNKNKSTNVNSSSVSASSSSSYNTPRASSYSSSSSSSTTTTNNRAGPKLDSDQVKLYEKSLQKLQKRDLKRKRFTLNDGDSEEEGDVIGSSSSAQKSSKKSKSMPITSLGATLGDIDEVFDRNMMSALGDDYQDEDDDVEFRNEFAERANRRLEKLQALDAKGKTDEDRYMEIIRKSKLHKIERQKAREEQMDLTDELDENFKSLMAHLSKRKVKREREADGEESDEGEEDDYDKAIRNFSFQSRTTPEILTKTDKETAEQRKARLEKLEQERLARMNVAKKQEKKPQSSVEALDYEEYLSDNDEDIGSDDEIDTNIKLGVPDDAPSMMEDGDNDKEEEEEDQTEETKETVNVTSDDVGANIPFVIEAPTNHAELKELLEDRTPKEVAIIFTRVRDLNDPRLGSEQKAKMQVFLSLLIKHFKSYIHQVERDVEKKMVIDFSMLNVFFDHIFGLSEQFPRHAVSEFRNHLRGMHTDLNARLSAAKDNTESHGYPSAADLIFLKLISNVFPVTDFQHPISSAANIYIHQCLADCEIHSLRDVGAALFLCATAIHYNSEAKRYSPEVVNSLTKILKTVSASADEEKRDNVEEGVRIINWLRVKKNDLTQTADKTIDFNKLVVHAPQNKDKLSLIRCAVSVAKTYSEMFNSDLTNYAEIFEGLQSTLQSIIDKVFKADHEIKSEMEEVIEHIRSTSDQCVSKRKRLLYLDVKPQAIPQFTPLIYGKLKGKIVDDDKIRLKNRIMTQKVKKAQRSAIREIRKDNAFLSRAREEIAANDMKQRKEKYKQIVNDLESEKRQQYQLDFGNRQLARNMKQARKSRRPANRPVNKK